MELDSHAGSFWPWNAEFRGEGFRLGFRFSAVGFRDQGYGFKLYGLGIEVEALEFRFYG